ncbi:MAG: thioredoxin family protein [Acidobacteriota bacterium]
MSSPNDRFFTLTVVLVLMSLASAVAVLAMQNRSLKTMVRAITEIQQPEFLRIGSETPPLRLEPLSGGNVSLEPSADAAALVFAFRTDCPACKKTGPLWNQLATELRGHVQIAAVSSEPLDALMAYKGKHLPQYDLFAIQQSALADYKISIVPQTILIGDRGLVLGVWPGELSPGDADSIKRMVARENATQSSLELSTHQQM